MISQKTIIKPFKENLTLVNSITTHQKYKQLQKKEKSYKFIQKTKHKTIINNYLTNLFKINLNKFC